MIPVDRKLREWLLEELTDWSFLYMCERLWFTSW
jgi:hypothetical protein